MLVVRPYDIGDRIVIVDPGRPPEGFETLIVSEINLTCTRVICWNGEQHTLMNHIIRRHGVINMHRSGAALVVHKLELPASISSSKISELIDAVRAYVASQPADWVRVASASIVEPHYQQAYLEVHILCQSAHKRCDEGLICARAALALLRPMATAFGIACCSRLTRSSVPAWHPPCCRADGARSNLYLFIHHYLQAAGVEYTHAPVPVRAAPHELQQSLLQQAAGRAFGAPPVAQQPSRSPRGGQSQ